MKEGAEFQITDAALQNECEAKERLVQGMCKCK